MLCIVSFHSQEGLMTTTNTPLLILVAGPYRSGTNDNPDLIAANMRAMNDAALKVFRQGHLPMVGEWLALPMMEAAGSTELDAAAFMELFHPAPMRMLPRCDALLRIGGPSKGADEMVKIGQEYGLHIYYRLEDIPDLVMD
jgi:hypothetical protein